MTECSIPKITQDNNTEGAAMDNIGYKICEREGSMNVYNDIWSDSTLAEIESERYNENEVY